MDYKVGASALIFIGRVTGIERPQGIEGVNAFARVEVSEVIKGNVTSKELDLVIRGSMVEADPDCCEINSEYLFFAVLGTQVFYMEGSEIGGSMDRKDEFVSPTNGRFSTYRLASGNVECWRSGNGSAPTPLTVVRSEIESLLNLQKEAGVPNPGP